MKLPRARSFGPPGLNRPALIPRLVSASIGRGESRSGQIFRSRVMRVHLWWATRHDSKPNLAKRCNRVAVFSQWVWSYLFSKRGARLITRADWRQSSLTQERAKL